jgi:hypothetical protein
MLGWIDFLEFRWKQCLIQSIVSTTPFFYEIESIDFILRIFSISYISVSFLVVLKNMQEVQGETLGSECDT